MTETPRSNRYHIAVFGRRNVGKSSLVNCLAGQSVSIVSDVAGTTTDTVWKNIELPGIGAAVIGDTAGFDDVGTLGAMRVDAARRVLLRTDLAVILLGDPDDAALEKEWYKSITARHLPVILAVSKCDSDGSELRIKEWRAHFGDDVIPFSSVSGEGREALLEKIAQCSAQDENLDDITYTLVKKGDIVVLYAYKSGEVPDLRRTMVFRCSIEDITTETVVLRLRSPQSNAKVFFMQQGDVWCIEHDYFESSVASLMRGLYSFLTTAQDRRDLLLLQREPRIDKDKCLRGDYSERFNDLMLRVKQASDFFLIVGPPGTGKTSYGMLNTLKEELTDPDSSVLLLSYTNRAVDEIF